MPVKTYILSIALVVLAGCAGTEVSETAQTAPAEVLVTTMALLADDDAEDKRREYRTGEWTYCDVGCKFQRQLDRERKRDATKRRQRRHETERLRADFDAFIAELDPAAQSSAQPSPSVVRRERPIQLKKF